MQTVQKLPTRKEMAAEYTWDLEAVYADESLWEADFRAVKSSLPQLTALQGTLGSSAGQLLAGLRLRDDVHKLTEQVAVYARMRRDEDNADSHNQALADRAMALGSEVSASSSFFTPEILAIPEDRLNSFRAASPDLELYRHYLEELARQRPHVRTAEVEDLLARAGEIARTADSAYSMLTDADLKFPTVMDEDGRPVELTQSRYGQFRESQDRRVRRDAFHALHQTYHDYRNTVAAALAGSIRSDLFFSKARNYPNSMEAALAPNNIPTAVYHNLIQTVDGNLHQLHRYMALRKKRLGVEELHHYDLYVPMVPEVDVRVPYEEATRMVQAALAPMGPEYMEALRKGLESRWIDVYENEGKYSGAYSDGSYTTPPFVLLNYQGLLNDVFTLAHELGHSMHSYFTRTNQPYIYGDYTLFVAEVASTVNESLLTRHLLDETSDPKMRAYLINGYMERFRTTLFRQTMFAEFELEIHNRAEAGESLTPDLLSSLYRDLNTKYYGVGVVPDEEIAMEWARIHHFYWDFYVYQYATGISAAVALSEQILTEGPTAAQRYLRFLKSGSSRYSIELLKEAGVDMASPEPIQRALDLFGMLIDQMETM